MRENKGITLVALIITIIVMMILVAVSVTVALDGGLFNTAKKAASETQARAEEEMLLSAVVGAIGRDGRVDLGKIQLPVGFTGENGIYTSSNGNVFQVLENGEIVQGWIDNGDETYTKGDKTIKLGETTATNSWLKQEVQKLGGNYQGDWQVIGLEGAKLKLVTTENVANSIYIGYADPGAKAAIPAVDESALTDEERYQRAIWSYKNAVDTLNKAAQNGTGIKSARSIKIEDIYGIIGEENVDKSTSHGTYGTVFRYYFSEGYVYYQSKTGVDSEGDETWTVGKSTGFSKQTYIDENGKTVIVDSEGDEVILTYDYFGYTLSDEQKEKVGSLATNKNYWFASSCVHLNTVSASYRICAMSGSYLHGDNWLIYSSYTHTDYIKNYTNNVRAVVTI